MIELRLGWFAPHRAGGWRNWMLSVTAMQIPPRTWFYDACCFGFTLALTMGWGLGAVKE